MLPELYKQYADIPTKVINQFLLAILNLDDLSPLILRNKALNSEEQETLQEYINKYRNGSPVEYITGICNFYGTDLIVDKNTLIPRIETEILVEKAINYIKDKPFKVLDLCTGSGVIAISIAKKCKNVNVFAFDVSPLAIDICNKNIAKHNMKERINVRQMNLLQSLPDGNFDLIVSNPPYIETNIIQTLDSSVKDFEPHLALDGGSDGLKFYQRFYEYTKLQKNCMFMFEIGYNQGNSVSEIFQEYSPIIIKDLQENDRIITFIT